MPVMLPSPLPYKVDHMTYLVVRIGQSGGVRTHTLFLAPNEVASHMALTLMVILFVNSNRVATRARIL